MAAVAVQAATAATSASASTLSPTGGNPVVAANAIVAVAFGNCASPNPVFSDGINKWQTFFYANGNEWAAIGVAFNIAASSTLAAVTIKNTNAGPIGVNAQEVSGLGTGTASGSTSLFIGQNSGSGAVGVARNMAGPSWIQNSAGGSLGGLTCTNNSDYFVAVCGDDGGSLSLPGGFTNIVTSNSSPYGIGCYKIPTVYQNLNPSFGTAAGNWAGLMLGIKATSTARLDFLVKKPSPGAPIRTSVLQLVTGMPASLVGLGLINTTGSTRWVQLFDANAIASVTLGVTLPDLEFQVAQNAQINPFLPVKGVPFANGICAAVTATEGGSYVSSNGDVLMFPQWE